MHHKRKKCITLLNFYSTYIEKFGKFNVVMFVLIVEVKGNFLFGKQTTTLKIGADIY